MAGSREAGSRLSCYFRRSWGFAWHQVFQDDPGRRSDELMDGINEGYAAWDKLTTKIGLDLRGVFRRRRLAELGFANVPRHVAHPKTPSKSSQFWTVYERATDAFVMGNFHAAIVLLRAIVESLLERAYGARVFDLRDKIKNVRDVLPPAANEAALLRLRGMAVAILHLESTKMSEQERQDAERRLKPERIEDETRQLLRVVCALIEGAPENPNDCHS